MKKTLLIFTLLTVVITIMKKFRTGYMFLLIFIVFCITGCNESMKRSEDQHTNQTITQKVQAENVVNSYLTAVSEK